MKRLLPLGLTVGLLSCTGCFTFPVEPIPPVQTSAGVPLNAPTPVSADSITAENCHRKAKEFQEELDREAQQVILGTQPR